MKRHVVLSVLVVFIAANTFSQAPSANPLSDGTRFTYSIMKRFLTQSAAKMSADQYGFRPTPAVRSFGEFIGHVADSNFRLCAIVAGETPTDTGYERGKMEKVELTKALADSFAYCDKIYNAMTDPSSTSMVTFPAGAEGLRNNVQLPKLTALSFLTQANFEHYGNLVTYMRMKGIVPPSSELPPPKPPSREGGSKKDYSDIGGEWNLMVETPNGPIAATLMIKVEGENLSGEVKFDRGAFPVSGTLTTRELRFAGKQQTLTVTFTAQPDNNSMSGKVEFAGHPSGTWTATRP